MWGQNCLRYLKGLRRGALFDEGDEQVVSERDQERPPSLSSPTVGAAEMVAVIRRRRLLDRELVLSSRQHFILDFLVQLRVVEVDIVMKVKSRKPRHR